VGDEANVLSAIENAMTGQLPECEVLTAGDADEAMAIAADRPIDAALIDTHKPQIGGIELCRRLRSNTATAHIAIILMTAHDAGPGDKDSGLRAGADDFLGIPIDQTELIARVSSVIRIKKSEDRFRRLFEQSNDAIFIHSPEGEILDVNERACQMLGWTKAQLLEMSVPQLHPESELEKAHSAMKNMSDLESVRLESVFKRADGELIDVEISARIVDPAAGTVQGVARDITDRKRLEETLQAERDFAEGMIEAAQAVVLVLDTEARIVRFNPYMERISGYSLDEVRGKDWFSTFLPDRDHEQIRKVFGNAVSNIRTCGNVNSILTKTGRERRIEWYDKTLKDANGDVVGVLAIGHDITQREITAESLRESEATNRSLLEGSPVCNKIIDLDFKLRYMSSAGVRDLKIPDIQPYYGQTYPPEFYPESMRTPLVEALKLAMAGLTSTVEAPVRDMEGDIVWYHTTFVPALDSSGQVKHIIGSSVNITERKQAEKTLLDSEERYRQVVATTTDAVMIFDAETREFIDVNEACTTLYGYSRREFLNMRQDDITAEPAESDLTISRTVSGQLHRIPLRYHRKKDGTTFPVEISASSFDLAGRQVVCGLVRDITEQKLAEAKLLSSEERFRTLAMSAPTGIYQADSEGKGVYVNLKICQLTGMDPKTHHGDGWIEAVHPADRQHTRQAWQRTVRGESDFQGEFRFASDNGRITWVSSSVARITDPDGAVTGFIGTLTDITERKQAEETLRENEQKYRTLFENMAQGAFYQRKDGALIDVNTAALRMLGLSRDQFIGKTPVDNPQPIIREDGSAIQYHEYASARALETGKPVRNEIGGFYNQRTGNYVWLNVNAIPQFRPGETEPYQVFVTLHDITERRNLETQLRQAQKMEAIGRLAGGIAHDFRNQLTIIEGYSDWLLSHLHEDGVHARYVRHILDATNRSSRLTGHMLAFSRRETLAPTVVAPMTLIEGLLEPLGHMIGDNVHLETCGADDLDNICIDTAQFENMMVNLAVNARRDGPGRPVDN